MSRSLPGSLCIGTLAAIVERAGLTEVVGPDGGPFRTLRSPMSPEPVGRVRVFSGEAVAKVVYVGLAVPAIGLDSHMVFAFAPADVAVPHFTLDSVQGQGSYAFHLDLIPRADLATHLTYVDWAHTPLTDTFDEVSARPGLSKAAIGPRQFAMMSPWMLVHRADEDAFAGIGDAVGEYLDHWFGLLGAGVPAEVAADLADTDLAARDHRNRANIFSPDVDKVWAQVERLLGPDAMEDVRAQLLDNKIVSEVPA
ncbi:hypothetical protein IEZ26_19105 [Nocardioides cavernae]|uniref:Oxidoreductase n=1 Tax=Nocardioides cavernae TaxID=1921566 RepID=A0ABR8NHI2_9ACTN|nr:hypothetical protein [Nocardioides cavernae]MBD3926736.1 hypothetical protein [Nocardioides cavernae]MBM7512458.1 hypothetical protein [Nocardioides cavernae]